MNTHDLYWLAGVLEGEGSFFAQMPSARDGHLRARFVISLQMADLDIVARVATLLSVTVTHGNSEKTKPKHYRKLYQIRVRGAAAREWARRLYKLMGERRQKQITAALLVTG